MAVAAAAAWAAWAAWAATTTSRAGKPYGWAGACDCRGGFENRPYTRGVVQGLSWRNLNFLIEDKLPLPILLSGEVEWPGAGRVTGI